MPQSALATGMVDLTLNVAQIGSSLREYLKNPHIQSMHQEELTHMDLAEDYSCILNAISLYSDIDFTIYKTNTIYRGLNGVSRSTSFTEWENIWITFCPQRKNVHSFTAICSSG